MKNFVKELEEGAFPRLEHLFLFQNYINSQDLVRGMYDNLLPNLKKLQMMQCGIGNDGFAAIMTAIFQCDFPIQYLDMSSNGIGDSGIGKLLGNFGPDVENAIPKIDTLKTLILSHNEIGNQGMTDLSQSVLVHLPNLTNLNLSENKISDAGIKSFGDQKLKNLHLDLSANRISDEGIELIKQKIGSVSVRSQKPPLD